MKKELYLQAIQKTIDANPKKYDFLRHYSRDVLYSLSKTKIEKEYDLLFVRFPEKYLADIRWSPNIATDAVNPKICFGRCDNLIEHGKGFLWLTELSEDFIRGVKSAVVRLQMERANQTDLFNSKVS